LSVLRAAQNTEHRQETLCSDCDLLASRYPPTSSQGSSVIPLEGSVALLGFGPRVGGGFLAGCGYGF